MTSSAYLKEFLLDAREFAWQAGQLTLAYFQKDPETEWKPDNSPVTIADKQSEALIREKIEKKYPTHSIFGEEYGEKLGNEIKWILDPIDGTRSFARGIPVYGVQIGIEIDGESQVGVIYFPVIQEMVSAAKGLGCTLNGRRSFVSSRSKLSDALMFAQEEHLIREKTSQFDLLVSKVYLHRNWGDCFMYAQVATGRAEIALDPRMFPWDNAPLLPIIEEAGGRFTTWEGQRTNWEPSVLATNGLLHEEVLAYLNQK